MTPFICRAKDCDSVALPSGLCGFHEEAKEAGEVITFKAGRGRPAGPVPPKDYSYIQVRKRPGFRPCAGTNRSNGPCQNQAKPDSDYCECHRPKENAA